MESFFHNTDLVSIEVRRSYGFPISPSQQRIWDAHLRTVAKQNRRRGVKLKAFRRRIGVSQSALARLVRVSRRSICHYESGTHAPRRATQWLLLYLGYDWLSMKWSLGRSDAIRRIGEMETLSPEGVINFLFWWRIEQGDEVRDHEYTVLRIVLERWLNRPMLPLD